MGPGKASREKALYVCTRWNSELARGRARRGGRKVLERERDLCERDRVGYWRPEIRLGGKECQQ